MLTSRQRNGSATCGLTAAVVVCTSSWEREPLLRACIDSLLDGERRPEELFVVVDSNPLLAIELSSSLPAPVQVLECRRPGLSAARNIGISAASSDIVAFLDDDATADRCWLSSVVGELAADAQLLGVGGPVVPRWDAERRWMPDELLWVVGCTYGGHRDDAGPIRNPIGCNMAFRRRELIALGSFETSFGKRGRALATCDETELALRLESAHGPDRIRFVPEARVHHVVPAARVSWRLLMRRSVSEGLAKGRLRRLYSQPALGPERSYARLLITESVPRLLLDGVRQRDRDSALGAVAIFASLSITGAAFAAGSVRGARREAQPARVGAEAVGEHAAR
jgi:GT2 family glycosyltransferase